MNKKIVGLPLLLLTAASLLAACGGEQPSSSSQITSSSISSSEEKSSETSSKSIESSESIIESSEKESSVVESSEESSSVPDSSSETSSSSSSSKEPDPVQTEGSIQLNGDFHPDYAVQPYEMTYGDYSFEFANTAENTEGYITLKKGGYMLNTTAFGDIDSFKVEYSVATPGVNEVQSDLGFGGLYFVTDKHEITSPRSHSREEVTNNTLIDLEDNPNYIAFYTFNEIDIKNITINYSTTATYQETFEEFNLQVFATNDIHGQVNADDTHAGLNNVAGYIEEQKAYSKYNVLLDQGDIYQGSLACYLTGGHIMDDFLLTNGYDSTILGNHEWDWMEPNILSHREYSPLVKLLACNVRYKDDTTPNWVRNYYTVQRGGLKIGVIGALGDIAGDISADMIENIKFVTGDPLTNMIEQYAGELKDQGCDFVILQIHAGSNYSGGDTQPKNPQYTEIDYSKLGDDLDLVLESHSHKSYYHIDEYGIRHMQCGGYFSGLGKLTYKVTFTDGEPSIEFKRYDLLNATTLKTKNSTFFQDINSWYSENVYKEKSEEVVATLDEPMLETDINQNAAKAYLNLKDEFEELKGYDVAVAGGHINCRSPKKLGQGNVTQSDVTNLFPFDNEMYLAKINGKDLKYNFLKSNNYLAGSLNSSSTTNFNADYYIILDSYNYFFLTKQLSNPIKVDIIVNITELHGTHPRDAFAMYLNKTYPIQDSCEITNADFDFEGTSSSINVKTGLDVNLTYADVADNSKYNQFLIKKNNGSIKITVSEGYIIKSFKVKQYQTYKNLTFFSDDACENGLEYDVTNVDGNGEYTITNTTNTVVIKNASNYDVKLFYVSLSISK